MRLRKRADDDGRLRALRSLPELRELSGSDLRGLLSHFDELEVPAGTVLARAGRFCTEYLVVLDGRIEARAEGGSRAVPAGSSSGWEAMSRRGLNPVTMLAASDARLLVMGRTGFRAVAGLRQEGRLTPT